MSLTSPEPGFTPRREFIRDHQVTPNSFSLLAIAGANCIRLYSFPLPLMTALRRLLDQKQLVAALREDIDQQLCEIALGGKPWNSAKSLGTEKLLVEILAVIYQHGYTYLSTIDYGREADDRLAMAFSKPSVGIRSLSPADSPLPASLSLNRQGKRIPFALSFLSATMLRVIGPPLHSTPAILQAVRGAWPRGVVSEKKVGENCFEFKLKGYKWFHEDTFATDSLRYILSLLASLDAHSFSLLTSMSLTSRSRIKDLWIFTGPAASSMDSLPESPAPSILNSSHAELKRAVPSPEAQSSQSLHRRLASEPSAQSPVYQLHHRAATDNSPAGISRRPSPPQSSTNLLRKAGPRAQVPVSVHDTDPLHEGAVLRANLPSVVSDGTPDLTGVGVSTRTPDLFYSTSPFHANQPETSFPLLLPLPDHTPPEMSRSPTPPSRQSSPMGRASPLTPPLIRSNPSSSSPSPHPALTPPDQSHSELPTPGTPRLLGPTAFRDSAFSSSTNSTYDIPIPIKWTGMGRDSRLDEGHERRVSIGPTFPGGWQPTPIEEKPEDTGLLGEPQTVMEHPVVPTPDLQQVSQRVVSPDLREADLELRKSEAGLVGLIAASENQDESQGKGWVVVDVEGRGDDASKTVSQSPDPQTPSSPLAKTDGSPRKSPALPVPPAAKAIAIVDAIEAKNKSASKSKSKSNDAPRSGIKKFFPIRRKDSNAPSPTPSIQTASSESRLPVVATEVSVDDTRRAIELVSNASEEKTKTKSKVEKEEAAKPKPRGLRDKLHLKSTPET
ncbi:hypothetical protein B0H10DRAFT_1996145 [Mycena sp. CBHHK59/15]|nr:hypothetical protein B0H10DRAFT_1996145 [Mycena sp. CBHHK59/15]